MNVYTPPKKKLIYYNKFKTSNLIISNTPPHSPNFLIGQMLYIHSNGPWETVSPTKIICTLVLLLQLFPDVLLYRP